MRTIKRKAKKRNGNGLAPLGLQISVHALQHMRVRRLARQVTGNLQLKQIILDAQPEMRSSVYEMIRPFLSFVPLPYLELLEYDPTHCTN